MKTILSQFPQFQNTLLSYHGLFLESGYKWCAESYLMFGMDFVLDLVLTVDILHPLVEIIISVQGLSRPFWSIVPLLQKLEERMVAMQENELQ